MTRIRLLLPLAAAALLAGASTASGGSATQVVVAQVFAGGGNADAPYQNDFVDLFNRSAAAVDLTGWTLQYASAAGTSWQPAALAGTVPAGGHYLVQLASTAAVGSPLPTPDATGTSNLAVSGGKVALVSGATALTCGASPGSCAADPSVEDLVGYGSAADYEGAAPAPAPSATTALLRADGGCTDADASGSDFATAAPEPLSSAAAAAPCQAPSEGGGPNAAVAVDVQSLLSVTLDRPTLSFPAALPGTTPDPLAEQVTVSSNAAAGYALSVHRTAFAPGDLPLGIGVTLPPGASAGGAPSGGSLAPIPVVPAVDLLLGSTAGVSAPAGDVWATSVGFASPLPVVAAGHYTATVTFTVIGR